MTSIESSVKLLEVNRLQVEKERERRQKDLERLAEWTPKEIEELHAVAKRCRQDMKDLEHQLYQELTREKLRTSTTSTTYKEIDQVLPAPGPS